MNTEKETESVRDRTARWLATALVSCQLRLSRFLSRQERKMNAAQKKALLLLFCCILGSYFSFLLLQSLLPSRHSMPGLPQYPESSLYQSGADSIPKKKKETPVKEDSTGITITNKKHSHETTF